MTTSAPAVSAQPPGSAAVVRVPQPTSGCLHRIRSRMGRVDQLLAPEGAVVRQLADAVQQAPAARAPPPQDGPALEAALQNKFQALKNRLSGHDMDAFAYSSSLAVGMWLASLDGWSHTRPLDALPELEEQLEMASSPLFLHSLPALHPLALQQHGQDVWVVWQATAVQLIARLSAERPHGEEREKYSSHLHYVIEKAKDFMNRALDENPTSQLAELISRDGKGRPRLSGVREARELLALGPRGYALACRAVHELQHSEGGDAAQQHLPEGGMLTLAPFGVGLPAELHREIKARWQAKEEAMVSAAAAVAAVAAAAAPQKKPAKTPTGKAAKEATTPRPKRRRKGDGATRSADAGGDEREEEEEGEEDDDDDEETPKKTRRTKHNDVALEHSANDSGYLYVQRHNRFYWRAERKSMKKDNAWSWRGEDYNDSGAWVAAYEHACWKAEAPDEETMLTQDEWLAHPQFEHVLKEAEAAGVIGATALKMAQGKIFAARRTPATK